LWDGPRYILKMSNVKTENQCAKHAFKLIYSFVMGNENKLSGSWRIYKCSSCRELKLLSNKN